jgi:hypothetical protein
MEENGDDNKVMEPHTDSNAWAEEEEGGVGYDAERHESDAPHVRAEQSINVEQSMAAAAAVLVQTVNSWESSRRRHCSFQVWTDLLARCCCCCCCYPPSCPWHRQIYLCLH